MMHMQFGKPPMRLIEKIVGQTCLGTHLSRWIKAYGVKLVQMHTILAIGNGTDKEERARQVHERRIMIRPSVLTIIHGEAFDKV